MSGVPFVQARVELSVPQMSMAYEKGIVLQEEMFPVCCKQNAASTAFKSITKPWKRASPGHR